MWREEAVPNSEGKTFEKKKLKRLQSLSRRTDATIWIGRDGTSEELLKHVSNQLKARELVKLKVHKAALMDSEMVRVAERVAASTGATLVDVMGHTFTLYKKREQIKRKSGL